MGNELIGKSAVMGAAVGKALARSGSAEAESDDSGKKYVVHGMYAECSMGTMKNYLNTDVGHGVVYQGQPLLNANDHAPQINLTHFGDCNSKMIFEEAKKQADEKYKAEAGDSFFERAGKAIAKNVTKAAVTVQECFAVNKCQLDTPLPWNLCNEEHMIDGAPALTIGSVCPCKFGGIISIMDTQAEEAAAAAAEAAATAVETTTEALEAVAETLAAEAATAVAEAAVAAVAAKQQAYTDMMRKSYGFDETQALLIQKAYELSGAKKDAAHAQDFVANMAAITYGDGMIFNFVDGIPKPDKAQKYFKKLGLSEEEVNALTEAVKAQHSGDFNAAAQEEKDFAHEMAVYAGYFNGSKPHRVIMDMWPIRNLTGDMYTLNSYAGDVYSGSMNYDDMNTDMDALNIYNLYTKTKGQDFLEVLTEYNQDVLSGRINRAESFLENLGDGDAEKGLEKLEEDLNLRGIGGDVIKEERSESEIDGTKQEFLDYIEEVRQQGCSSPFLDALYHLGHLPLELE